MIEEGRIAGISHSPERSCETLDAAGRYVLPGLVDLHSDAVEKQLEPRPGVVVSEELAFLEMDRYFASSGITTGFHAISFMEDRNRSLERGRRLCDMISGFRSEGRVRHELHLRCELPEEGSLEAIEELASTHPVKIVSIMDHTPGQGQFRDLNWFRRYWRDDVGMDEGRISAASAIRFAGPVLMCVAFAQTLMNGGPILVSALGGAPAQVGLLGAALILTRIPQYIMSPVIGALLPHASRILSTGGPEPFGRFIARALAMVGLVGVSMVGGAWLFGEWGIKIFAGSDFDASREVLAALAALAAFYLLGEVLNQALFARSLARLAALGWAVGLASSLASLAVLRMDLLERVSFSLALGAAAAVLAQAALYLLVRRPEGPR